jgi:hypothetical protein
VLKVEAALTDLSVAYVYHWLVASVAWYVHMVVLAQLEFFVASVLTLPPFHLSLELAEGYLCWFETHIPRDLRP